MIFPQIGTFWSFEGGEDEDTGDAAHLRQEWASQIPSLEGAVADRQPCAIYNTDTHTHRHTREHMHT